MGLDEKLVRWAESFMRGRRVIMGIDGQGSRPQEQRGPFRKVQDRGHTFLAQAVALIGIGGGDDPGGRPVRLLRQGRNTVAGDVA